VDTSQLLKGVLPTVALAVVAEEQTYGYQVLNTLRSRGLTTVGDASVYGTLQRLYEDGSLSSFVVPSAAGPSRKYYAITEHGRSALKADRGQWDEFHAVVTRLLASTDGDSW
jgi:PadR family transcriptional regulator, regulatory protein PadR